MPQRSTKQITIWHWKKCEVLILWKSGGNCCLHLDVEYPWQQTEQKRAMVESEMSLLGLWLFDHSQSTGCALQVKCTQERCLPPSLYHLLMNRRAPLPPQPTVVHQNLPPRFWAPSFQGGDPSVKEGCCSPHSPAGGRGIGSPAPVGRGAGGHPARVPWGTKVNNCGESCSRVLLQ